MNTFQLLPLRVTKDVEKITNLNSTSVYNLSKSGRFKTKKINGKLYFCNNSITNFMQSFKKDDYCEVDEVTSMLKKSGVWDNFNIILKSDNEVKDKTFAKKNKICRVIYDYNRFLKEFPISPKQLLDRGLITADKYLSPTLYLKSSVIEAIKVLKQKKQFENAIETEDKVEKEISTNKGKLLKKKMDKWEKEMIKSKIKKTTFSAPKPTLSKDEIDDIEKTVREKYKVSDTETYEKLPIKKGKFVNNPTFPKKKVSA